VIDDDCGDGVRRNAQHLRDGRAHQRDEGKQARLFGASILARIRDQEPPANGYVGDYVNELAEKARGAGVGESEEELMDFGLALMVERFKALLARLGVSYDGWFSERSLWETGEAPRAIERLRERGLLKERDGATWFAPAMDEEGGDADDRVVFRSDGVHTYFASDLGYLLNRFETRDFQRVIEVWGADHHGYVPRMKQACAALGFDPERLVIILNQFVTLKEGKMSKRAGRFVTLEELLDEVGPDAVRWFYLSRAPETMMEFDLELATTHNKSNPVYYVQYAHARLAGVERTASGRELPAEADVSLLDKPWELDVARQLAHWPDTVEESARLMEPHRSIRRRWPSRIKRTAHRASLITPTTATPAMDRAPHRGTMLSHPPGTTISRSSEADFPTARTPQRILFLPVLRCQARQAADRRRA